MLARARARVCWSYFANLSTVSVCLPVHTVTHTHTHTQATLKTQANTCQEMIENQHFHSTTVSQYSSIHEHTQVYIWYVFLSRSDTESELGNQLSAILRKASKQICILVCLCLDVCMRSESESASHSSPPQLKGVRVISARGCARVRVLVLVCVFVSRCTP